MPSRSPCALALACAIVPATTSVALSDTPTGTILPDLVGATVATTADAKGGNDTLSASARRRGPFCRTARPT
jgi:hypothetical protein